MHTPRVVVVGGGITGLVTALYVRDRAWEAGEEIEVTLLEKGDRPGGNIRTDRVEGFTIEQGPNGWLDNVPTTAALVRRLGLTDRLQPAEASAAKRFLYRRGRLHLLPSGPVGFLRSPVLSLPGRLRVMLEPFVPRRRQGGEETIHAFVSRRIGREAAAVLIDAMVSGIYAGDIRRLSLPATFPKLAAMEEAHGGLVRGMLARMGERRRARRQVAARRARGEEVEELVQPGGPAGPGGTLTSFRDGLDVWIEAMAAELGSRVRTGGAVRALRRSAEDGAGWQVEVDSGEVFSAEAVVLTPPAPQAVELVKGLDLELGREIAQIPTASLVVVALGFEADTLGGAPDGFGFLVPRGEGVRSLGALWDSSVFPGRAPEGRVLLRVMIGGVHDPAAVTLPDEELVAIARRDLEVAMGVTADPCLTRVYRHRQGIGQYPLGHLDRLARIETRLATLPGLWLAGASYHGISMNLCIDRADRTSAEVVDYLLPLKRVGRGD